MKKWEKPELLELGVDHTNEFDSSLGHACHQGDSLENCPDYTNGLHSYEYGRFEHTNPNWNDEHGHTCCCAESSELPIS